MICYSSNPNFDKILSYLDFKNLTGIDDIWPTVRVRRPDDQCELVQLNNPTISTEVKL